MEQGREVPGKELAGALPHPPGRQCSQAALTAWVPEGQWPSRLSQQTGTARLPRSPETKTGEGQQPDSRAEVGAGGPH